MVLFLTLNLLRPRSVALSQGISPSVPGPPLPLPSAPFRSLRSVVTKRVGGCQGKRRGNRGKNDSLREGDPRGLTYYTVIFGSRLTTFKGFLFKLTLFR